MTKGMKELVAEAKGRVREVDVQTAKAERDAEPRTLVLDVREGEEVAQGRVPGALHVPRGVLEAKAAPDSPAREEAFEDLERPILVYCGSGVRSAFAADTLQTLGFTRVASVDGGFSAWKEAGLPVE
ncbi:MAG: rhodanese-like domain-containing protein [Myxococcota bacterium]|nr:rhodanese-like domain-containing protein [Myxococcota bacterium]